MRSKKFIKSTAWGCGLIIILCLMIGIVSMVVTMKNIGLGISGEPAVIGVCSIIYLLIHIVIIISICRGFNVFINNVFSENPFLESTVKALKTIYKNLFCLTILSPILLSNSDSFRGSIISIAGFIRSIKINNEVLTVGLQINSVTMGLIALCLLVWVLSVCFEKATEIKHENFRLKEENDLTI